MIIGIFPMFLHSSNSHCPFRGLFTQLPYIYNTPLKLESAWLCIGCKLIENHLRTGLVGLPVLIRNHVMYGNSTPPCTYLNGHRGRDTDGTTIRVRFKA